MYGKYQSEEAKQKIRNTRKKQEENKIKSFKNKKEEILKMIINQKSMNYISNEYGVTLKTLNEIFKFLEFEYYYYSSNKRIWLKNEIIDIINLRQNKVSYQKIANKYNCSIKNIYRILKDNG